MWNLRTWPLELIQWPTQNSHRLDIRVNPEPEGSVACLWLLGGGGGTVAKGGGGGEVRVRVDNIYTNYFVLQMRTLVFSVRVECYQCVQISNCVWCDYLVWLMLGVALNRVFYPISWCGV